MMSHLAAGSVPLYRWCGLVFLLGTAAAVINHTCNVKNCLSPQLGDATKSKDAHTICRLLTPSLHCMELHLPSCKKLMGEDSEMYQQFVKHLDKLKIQYADKCNAIFTTCTEFTKCLRPQIQKASYQHDVQSLCKDTPAVIACFETAIHTCQAKTGEADANFGLIESKLEQLRVQTASRCDGNSLLLDRISPTTVSAMLVVVFVVLRLFQGRSLSLF